MATPKIFYVVGPEGKKGGVVMGGRACCSFPGWLSPERNTNRHTEGERQRKRKEIERYMALKNGEYYAVKKFRRPGFGPVVRAPSR